MSPFSPLSPFSLRKKKQAESPSTLAPASGLASSQVSQQLHSLTNSQSHLQSPQEKHQSQPVGPWSAHIPPSGQWPSPFPRHRHAISTTATAAGELFLFGGVSNTCLLGDLYGISTRDFSTTLFHTSGGVPSPRSGHCAMLVGTTLLIWGGTSDDEAQNSCNDDSFYLLNLGSRTFFMSTRAPAEQSFLRSSIGRVDPHPGQWSRALRSFLPYHDVGRLQALRLRWPDLRPGETF
jgi:hypothetical protein